MSDHFTKAEYERAVKWEFEGLQDAMNLMKKGPQRPSLVGRWDWHVWMFIISSCIPCFAVYCLAMWVRAGIHKEHEEQKKTKRPSLSERQKSLSNEITLLHNEITKLRLLFWLQGKNAPQLPPEAIRRLFEQSEETTAVPEEIAKPKKELSFSDRIWNSIKPWLPFYVEPIFLERDPDEQVASPFVTEPPR